MSRYGPKIPYISVFHNDIEIGSWFLFVWIGFVLVIVACDERTKFNSKIGFLFVAFYVQVVHFKGSRKRLMLESWNFLNSSTSSSDISDMLCLILKSGRTKYDF